MSYSVVLPQSTLRITEVFYSLQGETRTTGIPTIFIRLTGCPLRCQYCDTSYAFKGGGLISVDDILSTIEKYSSRFVTVTGGEPLAQEACIELLQKLCDQDYKVSLETSGAMDVSRVDPRVVKVLDFKTPGSAEMERNLYTNVTYLLPHDQVKFVICDEYDYQWAKSIMHQYHLADKCEVLFSPSHGQLQNHILADWILADYLPVRFQIQLQKYIWDDVRGK